MYKEDYILPTTHAREYLPRLQRDFEKQSGWTFTDNWYILLKSQGELVKVGLLLR